MHKHEKMTAPNPSAPTDGEQSSLRTEHSIPQIDENFNSEFSEETYEKILRRIQDPAYLPTMSMRELYSTVFEGKPPIISGLLHTGAFLLVGAPKVGKSFLVAQIAYHISTGQPLWGYPVRQGTVLYLALEDDYQRLQDRLFSMFGTEIADTLHLAVASKQLGNGLTEQLKKFLWEYPDTCMITIDTLQRIRDNTENYSYSNDYEVLGQLKTLADQAKICLLIVHHTRKQSAEDKFEMISGTNGLLGAADGCLLLSKEKRTDTAAVLDIVGRDQQDQRLYLDRDPRTLAWNLVKTETELWKQPPDPLLDAVAALISPEHPTWSGSATQLAEVLRTGEAVNALSYHLNVRKTRLLEEYHICYTNSHTSKGSTITLTLVE